MKCSLNYEQLVAAVRGELEAARQQRSGLQTQVESLEGRVAESMYYDRDRYKAMEAGVEAG